MKKLLSISLIYLFVVFTSIAQDGYIDYSFNGCDKDLLLPKIEKSASSENGFYIYPHGTIRMLIIFVEIEYDIHPSYDPSPNGGTYWQVGELPIWKNDIVDIYDIPIKEKIITRYFQEASPATARLHRVVC